MITESFPPLAMRDVELEQVAGVELIELGEIDVVGPAIDAPEVEVLDVQLESAGAFGRGVAANQQSRWAPARWRRERSLPTFLRLRRGNSVPTLVERLRFGGPELVQITSDYHPEDAELQAFLRTTKERWFLAHMALTFPVRKGPPLDSATVQVHLYDDGDPSQTIAFSILPLSAGKPYEKTRGFTIGPNVNGGVVGISLGSVSGAVTTHGTDYLIGGPELSADPAWQFQPTPAQKLVGSTRLSMILRVPNGRTGKMSIDLSATILNGVFQRHQVPLRSRKSSDSFFERSF
jgi:hypothetical protein